MEEFTTNDIVKKASAEQLEKLFALTREISDIIEDIIRGEGVLLGYVESLAYCPDYYKMERLQTAAMAEMSNREKNK